MYNAISLFIISAFHLFPSVSSRSLHALLKKCNITTYYFILNEREIVLNVNVFFFSMNVNFIIDRMMINQDKKRIVE